MNPDTPKLDATVAALREVAGWLEAHPELEESVPREQALSLHLHPGGDAKHLAAIASAMGSCRKEAWNDLVIVRRTFGPVAVTAAVDRDAVCTKRFVGTRTVSKDVPVGVTTVEVEEPVYEWDCGPILGES